MREIGLSSSPPDTGNGRKDNAMYTTEPPPAGLQISYSRIKIAGAADNTGNCQLGFHLAAFFESESLWYDQGMGHREIHGGQNDT